MVQFSEIYLSLDLVKKQSARVQRMHNVYIQKLRPEEMLHKMKSADLSHYRNLS